MLKMHCRVGFRYCNGCNSKVVLFLHWTCACLSLWGSNWSKCSECLVCWRCRRTRHAVGVCHCNACLSEAVEVQLPTMYCLVSCCIECVYLSSSGGPIAQSAIFSQLFFNVCIFNCFGNAVLIVLMFGRSSCSSASRVSFWNRNDCISKVLEVQLLKMLSLARFWYWNACMSKLLEL